MSMLASPLTLLERDEEDVILSDLLKASEDDVLVQENSDDSYRDSSLFTYEVVKTLF